MRKQQQQLNQNVVVNITNPDRPFSPGLAGVLSFFIPGLGQIYKGQVLSGIAWLIVVPAGYCLVVIPGLILHVMCIMFAVSAKK